MKAKLTVKKFSYPEMQLMPEACLEENCKIGRNTSQNLV